MGKKAGVNTKAEEAKARKAATESSKKEKEERDREESKWQDEGSKSKAAKKKEEDAERKAEAARKKAELKKLAEAEEQEMSQISKKSGKTDKVTAAQLAKLKEKETETRAKAAAEAKKKISKLVDESEYEKLVGIENTNRMETLVDARSLSEAVEQLSIDGGKTVDAHPEKRMKAAYKAFEEAELPVLKANRPGLTLTQYKEQLWKSWKKSPLNPLNQTSTSGS